MRKLDFSNMPRALAILLGPEIYWVLVCLVTQLATRRYLAPDPAITLWLDDHWVWLPLVFAPVTFAFFLFPETSRWWLLLRVDLALGIGLVLSAWIFCNGMTYHQPSSGPGAGTAFMIIPFFGGFIAFLGTIIAAAILWWRGRGHA